MTRDDGDTTRILGDFDRQLANIARLGIVTEIDAGRARVQIGALVTDFIPWTQRRAAQDYDWWAPSLGEQVVVLALWGDVSQGVIIGSVAQDKFAPPAQGAVWAKRFRDKTELRYDPDNHQLDITAHDATIIVNCKTVNIKAENVTLDASSVHCTGSIAIEGDVTAKGNVKASGDVKAGGISLSGHKHPGVQSGGSTTGGPV